MLPAHRREGEAAVAVYDRGEALGQLRAAPAWAEERRIRVAVDVDEARSQAAAPRLDDERRARAVQRADGRYAPAVYGEVGGIGRAAGAVDYVRAADDVVEHGAHLSSRGTGCGGAGHRQIPRL